ncbi:deoxyhypusine monooxygenase [Nematocida sp. AWRm77]|nr:deoxyhypusine monooxygenase [Nematocida sp. AWRm77]
MSAMSITSSAANVFPEHVQGFSSVLRNKECPLKMRFRALFALRNIQTDEAVLSIAEAFETDSVLLKHELAYVLGQMQNRTALPVLARLLETEEENEIVRHEAAEAIAALGDPKYIELLDKYAQSKSIVVKETCEIGAELLRRGGSKESLFGSFDPALPMEEKGIEALKNTYLDESLPLYTRYSAMFRLRDIGSTEAVQALGAGFFCTKKSDLFEHEIAFIFGQLAHPDSAPYLIQALADETKHEMIRHECAEALGAIDSKEAKDALLLFKDSPNRIVRESAEIGLDIMEYKFEDPSLEYIASKWQ